MYDYEHFLIDNAILRLNANMMAELRNCEGPASLLAIIDVLIRALLFARIPFHTG